MRTSLLAVAALASLAASCQASPRGAPTRAPSPAPVAPAAAISGSLAVHDASGGAGPFSLAGLDRLIVDSSYQGPAGRHELRVDVLGPRGLLYGQLRGQLDVTPGASASASQALEVHGTPIESFRMVGSWQFVLTVDGSPLAAAAADVVD